MSSLFNWRSAKSILLGGACLLNGAIIRVTSDGNGGGTGDANQPPTPPPTIKIKVENDSHVSLDPQIYISDQFAALDQLFVPANKYTAYGVGTIGILADDDSASFTVECAGARI